MLPKLLRAAPLTAAFLSLAALPAFAHAHPKVMAPAANSTVAAPTEVSIYFSEALESKFSKLQLTDEKGSVLGKQPSLVDPKDKTHMTLALPHLDAGVYHVHWVSAATDGHRMDGDYSFKVK